MVKIIDNRGLRKMMIMIIIRIRIINERKWRIIIIRVNIVITIMIKIMRIARMIVIKMRRSMII